MSADISQRSTSKKDILKAVTFGARVAEDEVAELSTYFVETDQWRRIFAGDVDIVYGAKGSGKSAIYFLLLDRDGVLFDRSILIAAAENPRGTPVFRGLVIDPPASEEEFRNLWKMYLLSVIGETLRDYGVDNEPAKKLDAYLKEAQLLATERNLSTLLRSVIDYVRNFMRADSIEGGLKLDPITGSPTGFTGKITLREPNATERKVGLESVDALLRLANWALLESDYRIWLVLDRLDTAFAESERLEANALKALFRVYLDMAGLEQVSLKIFLRTDIWSRITDEGFREASHITRSVTLSWNKDALLNLVIRRALRNEALRSFYNVTESEVLNSAERQQDLFYRIFPRQVNAGARQANTLDWILSRTRDGLAENAPRELIHLLNHAIEIQLQKLERGTAESPNAELFERDSLKESLREVSKVRLEQTLYAEHPDLKTYLQRLEGGKTQQTPETLAAAWGIDVTAALSIARRLRDVGYFEEQGNYEEPTFRVPFLYRDALRMSQGSALPGQENDDQMELDL